MLAIAKNLKKVHLNSVGIFMSLRVSFTSFSHICIIVTYVENTHCWTILAQLHLSIKCFNLSSTVTIETTVRIQNPLTSLHECLRTGALSHHQSTFSYPLLLLSSDAVYIFLNYLWQESLLFLFSHVCFQKYWRHLRSSLPWRKMESSGQVQVNSLKMEWEKLTLMNLNTLGLPDRKYLWNRQALHRYQFTPIEVMAKVCSNDRFWRGWSCGIVNIYWDLFQGMSDKVQEHIQVFVWKP